MTITSESQAVAERKQNGPQQLIETYKADFTMVLPTHIKADQWIRLSQGILRRDKNLARVAQQNPASFLVALLDCARLGLEPGETYHFVPFGTEIVGITDYTGEIELMYRATPGIVIKADVVYSNDKFDWRPSTMKKPAHEADWFGERGEMVGVYAYAEFENGAVSRVVVMSKKQIDQVKAVSKTAKQASSPWNQWPDRMWLKTAVKQLKKWVPSSAEFREQVLRTNAAAATVSPALQAKPASDFVEEDGLIVDTSSGEVIDGELVEDTAAGPGQQELDAMQAEMS